MTRKNPLLTALKTLLLLLFLVCTLFPFYWMAVTSFKGDKEILTNSVVTFWPTQPTLMHYVNAFIKTKFTVFIGNSLFVTLISSAVVLVVSVFGGYAMARYNFRGKKLVLIIFLASQMVPLITAIIPLFVLFVQVNLLNTLWALIISYTANNIPFCLITMSAFFRRIPNTIEEAAQIDGCGLMQSIFRVVLPIMLPGIVAVFVFAFTGCWNELFYSIMLISSDRLRTIPAGLMNFVQKYDIDWGQMTAAATATLIPVVIMFIAVQKHIVAGLTSGSVKE